MLNINPLLLVGGVIGAVTALLIFAYVSVKDKKTAMGFERTMADGEILRRLFAYAKPYWAKFLLVLFLMLFSIAYDIISPLIVGAIEELVAADFALSRLFASVAVYAGILVFSMASTYFQAVILQRVGQRIISDLREDLFTHIESLSHEQLNERYQRYQRHFHDVHQPFGEPDQKCVRHFGHSGGHALPELCADPDGALLCSLHRHLHCHLPQVFPPGLP